MLETIALWWCYVAGATLAVALYAVLAMWTIDKVTQLLNVKRQIIEWYWDKLKAKKANIPAG